MNPFIREEPTRDELENRALGFIHLHNYEEVINIMITLIQKERYELGVNDGKQKMYDELKYANRLKKEKKNAHKQV